MGGLAPCLRQVGFPNPPLFIFTGGLGGDAGGLGLDGRGTMHLDEPESNEGMLVSSIPFLGPVEPPASPGMAFTTISPQAGEQA